MSFEPNRPPLPVDPGNRSMKTPSKENNAMPTTEKKDGVHISTDRLIGVIILIAGFFISFLVVNGEQKSAMKKDIESLQRDVEKLQKQQEKLETINTARYEKLDEKLTQIREIVVELKTKGK